MTDSLLRTTQLRRYVIREGVLPEFLVWWRERLVPVRHAYGFTIEFAYAIADTNEFIWAVSVAGDEATFAETEAAYVSSAERAAAFEGLTPWTVSTDVALVEVQSLV